MTTSLLSWHRPTTPVVFTLACLVGLLALAIILPPGGKLVAIPDKNGQPTMQRVIPAQTVGTTRMCNGHVVAAIATGCTQGGGVVFQDATKVVK